VFKRFRNLKIRTQLALVIALAGLFCMFLFRALQLNKVIIGNLLTGTDVTKTQITDSKFNELIVEQALLYDLPASEEDTEAIEALTPFFELADDYTGIYLYGGESGCFLAGRYAPVMDREGFRRFFDTGYQLTNGEGEIFQQYPLRFRNGIANVSMVNCHRALFVYPYTFICLALCIILFLGAVIFFVNRKMKSVLVLEQEVLNMSAGDLTHTVPELGGDEIGILARELDHMREALKENIEKEQESRKANQDLITALSHDLRTPLTILGGYLEVMQLKRNPQMQEDYLARCLKKTEDIKELTDRMFEYALVSEEDEIFDLTWVSTEFICRCLQENCDFIRLAGFEPVFTVPEMTGTFESDKTMLKRVFNNLFSNILKYGDKKKPVVVSGEDGSGRLIVRITNYVKKEHAHTGGNNIGLKTVRKIMCRLNGELRVSQGEEVFTAELEFRVE